MQLTIALAKGRLAQKAMEILEKCGVQCQEMFKDTRKLIFFDKKNDIRFIMVKPADVPTYVDHGVADMGIVGKDTLMEAGLPLYEMADLKFGKCRLVIAGYPAKKDNSLTSSVLRVATKYPKIAKKHYASKGESVECIKLSGSVELGPILGLSDVILDIAESGRTLVENGLVVIEEVCDVSARLAVNRASLKIKAAALTPLIERMQIAVEDV
ncbi:MAG: ATP phosphoribosyltransferase [Christensenellales bacterium]